MSSKDKMFPLVEQYQQSGLSISAFCKKNKLAASTFRYWIEQYNSSEKLLNKSSFIGLKTTVPACPSIEIIYPNKVSIRVGAATDFTFLKALINLY
jgi:transposase-like protein